MNPKPKEPVVQPDRMIDDHIWDITEGHSVSDGRETTYRSEALYAVADWYEAKIKELTGS